MLTKLKIHVSKHHFKKSSLDVKKSSFLRRCLISLKYEELIISFTEDTRLTKVQFPKKKKDVNAIY